MRAPSGRGGNRDNLLKRGGLSGERGLAAGSGPFRGGAQNMQNPAHSLQQPTLIMVKRARQTF